MRRKATMKKKQENIKHNEKAGETLEKNPIELLEKVLDCASFAIYRLDLDGKFTLVNQRGSEIRMIGISFFC